MLHFALNWGWDWGEVEITSDWFSENFTTTAKHFHFNYQYVGLVNVNFHETWAVKVMLFHSSQEILPYFELGSSSEIFHSLIFVVPMGVPENKPTVFPETTLEDWYRVSL